MSKAPRPLTRGAVWSVVAVLCFAISAVAVAVANLAAANRPLDSPVTITACAPADIDECGFGLAPDRRRYKVDDAVFPVAGVVTNRNDFPISYDITVSWQSVETDAEFFVIQVLATWHPGDTSYPVQEWAPPPSLVALAESMPQGTDLGRWKIVGRANPVDADRFAPYAWTSVEVFELEA